MADSDGSTDTEISTGSIAKARRERREASRLPDSARAATGREHVFPTNSARPQTYRHGAFDVAAIGHSPRDLEYRLPTPIQPDFGMSGRYERHERPNLSTMSVPPNLRDGHEPSVSVRDSGIGVPFVSGLPTNLQELIRRSSKFDEIAAFLIRHVNQIDLVEDTDRGNTFLRDAASAYRAGQTSHADRCVRAAITVRKCSDMATKRQRLFLENLSDGDDAVKHELEELFVNVRAAVISTIQTNIPQGISIPTRSMSRRPVVSSPTENTVYAPVRHGFSVVRPMDASGFPSEERPGTERSRHMLNHSRMSQARSGYTTPTSRSGSVISDGGSLNRLDERYQVRHSYFFKTGRVFAILWHESVASRPGAATSELATLDRFNECIISHIRRMVVVREQHGASWCVPINTYSGRGVAKKGISHRDIQSHAIIHKEGTAPYAAGDEPELTKNALAVRMTGDENLDMMSRVNFGKVHTVEHNVKALNVGMIAPSSMADFKEHWLAEVRRDLD